MRLPSAERYATQPQKEWIWLPRLAPHLPVAIPQPVALGKPDGSYPFFWIIHHWIDGDTMPQDRLLGVDIAQALAAFLRALHQVPTEGAPMAGDHNFHRGGDLNCYDAETRAALEQLDQPDRALSQMIWERALDSKWDKDPVWVHGDISVGNSLTNGGELAAVIDFGSSAIGDPACDLIPVWTFLDPAGAKAFREALPLPDTCWHRAAGWALWKALISLDTQPGPAQRTLTRLLAST